MIHVYWKYQIVNVEQNPKDIDSEMRIQDEKHAYERCVKSSFNIQRRYRRN